MISGPYVIAGALTGFFVGLTGIGGGALMTPLLLFVFGVPPSTAIATDLWFAAITKLVGARIHYSGGTVDWMIVKRLWLGSVPIAGVAVCLVYSHNIVGSISWLTRAVGVVLLLTATVMLFAGKLTAHARSRRTEDPEKFKRLQAPLTISAGAILGLCVALTSVGAGALGSVMLVTLYPLRMTPHRLIATDLVHAIPLAVVAGSGYLFAGMLDWQMLLSLLCGSIPTTIVGSLLSKKLAARWLQSLLSVALFLAGIKALA